MAKYLRINKFLDITSPDFTGHKYKLDFDIGDFKANDFTPKKSYNAKIEISDILEIIWGLDELKTKNVVGSICLSNVLELAKNNDLELLKPIILNTFTSGKEPPSDLYIVTEGSILSFAEKLKDDIVKKSGTTFLRYDIAEIRDNINTYTKYLLGKKILLINQERALLDMYQDAKSDTEFTSRIASLTGLIISIDKDIIKTKLGKSSDDNTGELILLEELITFYSNDEIAKEICTIFKKINDLRKGYPIHGDNIKRVLPAHYFFSLKYPIENYNEAWEIVLSCYFESMRKIRDIFIECYNTEYNKDGEK